MCKAFATLDDIIKLFRTLTMEESERAKALLPIGSNSLRVEAKKVNRNLDEMAKDETYASVLKSVTVDVVARTLMTSTNSEPMIQSSESALGYSSSGTYLVPGGGLFIKNTELARLGLKRPRWGMLDIYNIQF